MVGESFIRYICLTSNIASDAEHERSKDWKVLSQAMSPQFRQVSEIFVYKSVAMNI